MTAASKVSHALCPDEDGKCQHGWSEDECPMIRLRFAAMEASGIGRKNEDSGTSDPRPDPRTHPEYWTE